MNTVRAMILLSAAAGMAAAQDAATWEKKLKAAKVSLAEAIEKAQAEVKDGVVFHAELEGDSDKPVYSIDISVGDKSFNLHIDAIEGRTVLKEEEAEDHSPEVKASKATLADALKAALKKAGGQAVEIELLLRGDKAVYEVKIVAEGKMVDVNVDGVTGKVAGGAGKQDAPFTEVFMEDAADLGPTGTNPYFVLEPGYQLTLEGKDEGEDAVLVITVLEETKKVDGVETRVVEERETVGGKLIEVSRNWFAISRKTNNVYYFGEDVDMYKDGKVTGHGGSWESGKDGAKWGLQMPGVPLLGSRYYQEVAPKVAMDRAEIVSLSVTLETPAGKFEKCLKCEETTPLEPGNRESKIYARGIGLIQDGPLKLTKHGKAKK